MRPPGGRSRAVCVPAATLIAMACSGAHERLLSSLACVDPVISNAAVATNDTNVLAAFISARIAGADSVVIRFGVNGALDSLTPAFVPVGDSTTMPVYGLLPSTRYGAQLVAFNQCGALASVVLPFATGRLPADLPSYSATGSDPMAGFVVFGAGSYGVVIDNTGRVVWYHRFLNGPGLNFQVQPNGRYAARPTTPAGTAGSWVEIDPDGHTTRTLACAYGLPARMHDLIAQPDGSYWLLCDEQRTMDLSAQGASREAIVLGTDVQWRSATGDVLFAWSPFDHFRVELSILDAVDRAGPVINWTHGNSLDLDRDGNLLVSFRNLSEVTKIDVRTGDVIWRMGGSQGNVTVANGAAPSFVHQHGLRSTGSGEITLLDNLGNPSASRAERYNLDETRGTARLTALFGASAGRIAQVGGSVQTLGAGHVLVSFGSGDGLEEYDDGGRMVWKLDANPGYVFRAERVRSLYRPGVGDPR